MIPLEKNNIPAGYKDSVVGIIPQEWEVNRLGEICQTFKSGMTITSQNIEKSGLYPVYGGNGLRGYTDSFTHNGDYILIGRQGALCGNINFIRGKAYISEHAIAVQPNEGNSIEFLRYKLDFWNLNRFSESSAQPGLSVEKLVRYKLAIPPMAEQRKIAEILGVWDEAIEKQSRLIEKLELRKRALMQRLLTGRTRLPGFIDDVQYKKLKPFIVEKSERNTNQTYTNVLSVTNNRGFINQAEQFDREVASDNTANYKLVHRGQFAYNPSRVNVGSLDLLQTYDLGILSPMYIVFETRPTMDPKFLYYQLKSGWFVGHIPMYVQGSVRDSLSFDGLENMKFWIPPLAEQKAIAEVLTTADNEIATHRKKLDALRLQKRGLMQQLLTGKTRVKI